jgi:hypothetical protein
MMGLVGIQRYYAELARLIEQVGLLQIIRVNDLSREAWGYRTVRARKKGKEVVTRV